MGILKIKVISKVEYIYLFVHSTVTVVKDHTENGSYNIPGIFEYMINCCHIDYQNEQN